MNASYSGSHKGEHDFDGWLPKAYLPSSTKSFRVLVNYKENNVTTTKVQFLNVSKKGVITIPTATENQTITAFLFHGMIDLD